VAADPCRWAALAVTASRFSSISAAWDLVLAEDDDDTDPLTLMLVTDGDQATWQGVDAPSLVTDQAVYREQAVMWQPLLGAGHSRRTPETTGTGPDGQIVSEGISYGNNATFVVPGMALPAGKLTEVTLPALIAGASARIFDAAEFGASKDLWMTSGTRYALKLAAGTGAPTLHDFGAAYITRTLQIFDGKLYLSGETSGPIQEFNGTTWTAAAAQCQAARMERVNWLPSNAIMAGSGGGTPADHLILSGATQDGFYHVVSGNDPKVFANWIGDGAGNPIPVGDANYPTQNIVAGPRTVWFARPNGLHGVTETGRVVNLTPWVERNYHASNGGAVLFWSDEDRAIVFYGHEHGLVAVSVNGTQQESARFVQFGGKMANESPIWGRPRWMCPYVDVMRLIFEPDGSYRWSGSECTIRGQEITFMRVASPGGLPRLWIATLSPSGVADIKTVHLYWQSLPVSGNPWVDYQAETAHRFATEWETYLPRDDAGSSAPKVVRRYDIVARGLEGANALAVDAAADDAAYVEQGVVTGAVRSSFIATTYQDGVWFNWRLRAQNSETVPVAIETFQARMSVLPEQADAWTFRCLLAAGQGLHNDAVTIQDPYTVRARVRSLQRRGPILMPRSPLSRETLTVKVEQGSSIQAIKLRKTNETVVVLTLTISVLSQGAIYGVDSYGVGAEYGSEA
jgi:hypothetical protein